MNDFRCVSFLPSGYFQTRFAFFRLWAALLLCRRGLYGSLVLAIVFPIQLSKPKMLDFSRPVLKVYFIRNRLDSFSASLSTLLFLKQLKNLVSFYQAAFADEKYLFQNTLQLNLSQLLACNLNL